MRIAQLVSNYQTIPPKSSSAIYHQVYLLTEELVRRGHEVTLFAASDSRTSARLVSVCKATSKDPTLNEFDKYRAMNLLASKCYSMADQFDIIHSHFNLIHTFYSGMVKTPTAVTIHTPILDKKLLKILKSSKNENYISLSRSQQKLYPGLNWVANVYHGLNIKKFKYQPKSNGYLLSLGRITRDKGVHTAIKAAKLTGHKIIIAGKSYGHEDYWHKEIEPHIDGVNVKYVGELDHREKIKYFRNAKAFLFPTETQEAFGLTMIEAMGCGTPVIAFKKGSVPEIVKHGRTGYIVSNLEGMVRAIKKIDKIDRQACRERVEKYFTIDKMVTGYERVYQRIIDAHKNK